MRNWLEDQGADYGKIRKRVCSNRLLVNKIDSLIRGEMKSTYNLSQVVKGHGNSNRKRSSIAAKLAVPTTTTTCLRRKPSSTGEREGI